ncbi:Hypothetical protein BN69_3134 [Methylocystis sp. SC2]|nr:Hypothetical protein BN69_3134 [Methylocystis sp. SC2]
MRAGALTPAFLCPRPLRVMPASAAASAGLLSGAAWMAGTSPAMTAESPRRHSTEATFAFASSVLGPRAQMDAIAVGDAFSCRARAKQSRAGGV